MNTCLISTLLLIILMHSWYSIDGQLMRDRSVNCNSQNMEVIFEFTQPFHGIVFASNFYESLNCRWMGTGSRRLVVPVPLNTDKSSESPYCGVNLQEDSGEFGVTLVVTPMKGLLVDGMFELNVRCLYNIGDVTLKLPSGVNGAGIRISSQTDTGVVTGSGGSPFLKMSIREGHGIEGNVMSSASVGQRITLDVIMQDTAIYDFYVHSCYAHDGTNSPEASISIIDANGCVVHLARAVDVPTFATTPVNGGAKHVYVHMYGFQFTTSQVVYFECQVRPCLQQCPRSQCETRKKRASEVKVQNHAEKAKTDALQNYRLQTVLKIESDSTNVISIGRDEPLANIGGVNIHSGRVCVQTTAAICILTALMLVCVVSLLITLWLFSRPVRSSKNDTDGGSSSMSTDLYTMPTISSSGAECGPATKSFLAPRRPISRLLASYQPRSAL